MRWLLRYRLLPMLALAFAAPPALATGPLDGPGCIGVAVAECVRWLAATLEVDQRLLADSLAHRHDRDVNGRPLPGVVAVSAKLPGERGAFVVMLHLRPDDTVTRAEANLKSDVPQAHTEATYDQTKLYDMVWRLIGRRCPGLGKLDLYRFFENSVKPLVTKERKDYSTGINGLHKIFAQSGSVPLCGGVTLAYSDVLEWRGANDPEAAAKRTLFASIALQ